MRPPDRTSSVATCLARTTGRRSGSLQDVGAETDPAGHAGEQGQERERLEPVAVWSRRLRASRLASELRPRVRVQVRAEHDVVGHEDAVDAGAIGGPHPRQHRLPRARIFGR